jgi:hypothetical protein
MERNTDTHGTATNGPAAPTAMGDAASAFSFQANGDARESAGVCKRRVGVKEID